MADSVEQGSGPELRYDEHGTLDEIVARCAFIHLEQMGKKHWWLVLGRDGAEYHVHLTAKSKILALAFRVK